MSAERDPIIEVKLINPTGLDSLDMLVGIAKALRFGSTSAVSVNSIGSNTIAVRDWLSNIEVPE